MPQDTALGFPSSSPPLPHGSERSTSGFGTNQHPAAAIDRPFWVLLRSSASLRFFQKPGFAFGGVVQRPRRVCGSPMADTAPNGPQGAGAVQFMMTNKLDTAMWLSRLFTVYCSALFVLPVLGLHEAASFYQRALLANALTSALRLHQRLPHFQLSRAFLAQALLEDSCHYLLYSLIFVNSYPVTMSIFPVLLFSLLHAATYTKKVLDAKGSNSLPLLRSVLDKLSANQQNILKFIACNEIFLMPATVFMLFSGQGSLLQPFIYYRFLTLRYSSRRNPYCRTLFNELRIVVEHVIMKPACPLFVRRLCLQSIAFISRLAPTVLELADIFCGNFNDLH
uniref:Transmembrane protein 33 n=2 Tax=Ailuropoda melanoleuca TaxID=9646 RepID=G1M313_AILME